MSKVYKVIENTTGFTRFVRAHSKVGARNFAAADALTSSLASQDDLLENRDVIVEDATISAIAEPDPTKPVGDDPLTARIVAAVAAGAANDGKPGDDTPADARTLGERVHDAARAETAKQIERRDGALAEIARIGGGA